MAAQNRRVDVHVDFVDSVLESHLEARMRSLPATVVSTTLEGLLDWPDATVVSGDAVDVVARLKEESEVPLRSHGSLSMNFSLRPELEGLARVAP